MTDFLLIPGAGGVAWYWNRVVQDLAARGHMAVAVDLPGDDPESGLPEYAQKTVDAGRGLDRPILVAQSMGGFTAPLVWSQLPVSRVVFLNAMIPKPGERAGDWWGNVDCVAAQREAALFAGYTPEFDVDVYFLHDVPQEVLADGALERNEADRAFSDVCDFTWPDLPIHAVAGEDDRFFPLALQRRVARKRLDVEVDTVPGGHLAALSQPGPLADYLLSLGG